METTDELLSYEPPVVVELGDFAELTQGSSSPELSDNGDGGNWYKPGE